MKRFNTMPIASEEVDNAEIPFNQVDEATHADYADEELDLISLEDLGEDEIWSF